MGYNSGPGQADTKIKLQRCLRPEFYTSLSLDHCHRQREGLKDSVALEKCSIFETLICLIRLGLDQKNKNRKRNYHLFGNIY